MVSVGGRTCNHLAQEHPCLLVGDKEGPEGDVIDCNVVPHKLMGGTGDAKFELQGWVRVTGACAVTVREVLAIT